MKPPVTSVRIPTYLKTELKAIARQRGLSPHGVMVLAIREFVSAQAQAKTPAA